MGRKKILYSIWQLTINAKTYLSSCSASSYFRSTCNAFKLGLKNLPNLELSRDCAAFSFTKPRAWFVLFYIFRSVTIYVVFLNQWYRFHQWNLKWCQVIVTGTLGHLCSKTRDLKQQIEVGGCAQQPEYIYDISLYSSDWMMTICFHSTWWHHSSPRNVCTYLQ